MKNKKILKLMKHLVEDARLVMQDDNNEVTQGRYYCLCAAQGRFEQEIKDEKEIRKGSYK